MMKYILFLGVLELVVEKVEDDFLALVFPLLVVM